jgi:serine/threonine protein kinase
MTNDLTGKALGRYHLLEKIGEGGMAVVYKALDTTLERHVAIKVILPYRELSEKFLIRFKREAKALAKLSHPNILKVFEYGEYDNLPYLAMEYISGGTLKDLLKRKPVPWQKSAQILIPIARALETAHTQGIIHRDVKPSNILMVNGHDPMLSDFGIAKIIEDDEETADLTGSGVGIGTPDYMAPEQGVGKTDERSDIYALGTVFYQMITGRLPFKADTPMAVMLKKSTDPLPRPTQFVPDLPPAVENVMLKALARDPNNRYKTMKEFAASLDRLNSKADTLETFIEPPTDEITVVDGEGGIKPVLQQTGVLKWILSGSVLIFCFGVLIVGAFSLGWIFRPDGGKEATQAVESPSDPTEPPLAQPTLEQHANPIPEAIPTAIPSAAPTNGNLIAFNSRMGGNSDIYIVDINGNNLNQLTTSSAHDLYPSWSPNGTQLVYQTNEGGDQEVAIIGISGGSAYNITNNGCNDWGPVWSPDGDWIAFYSDCDGERNIYKIRTDGSDRTQLTFTSGANSWFPAWSPDGRMITFSSNRSGKYYIYSMDSNGGNETQLAKGCVSYYSPDGSQILYGVYCDDTDELWLMDADGSNQQPITDGYECKNATWSPDGTSIVFQRSKTTKDGPFQLYIMELNNPDPSNWILVTEYDVNGGSPVWQP